MTRILITGASGVIGTALRHGLAADYPSLRLLDIRPAADTRAQDEEIIGDLSAFDTAQDAVKNIDVVVHLAGVPREGAWEHILPNNIVATYNLFEAARRAGVKRIVFASTNHVVGYRRANRLVDAAEPVRPDSRYAVSKVFGEALGRLYADKHGIDVACLRIGSFRDEPQDYRQLVTWLSPRDMVDLVRACIVAPPFHFAVVFGVSGNKRRMWFDDAAEILKCTPSDNAEDFAGRFAAPQDGGIGALFHGGINCEREFSGDLDRID
jgi:uronate dehydrogenase